MFCAVSRIPFDLAFNGKVLEVGYQNVFFTLLLGLLTMMAYDAVMNQSRWSVWKRTALSTIAILPECLRQSFYQRITAHPEFCDIFYLFRVNDNTAGQVGCLAFVWWERGQAVFAFVPIFLLQWKTWL